MAIVYFKGKDGEKHGYNVNPARFKTSTGQLGGAWGVKPFVPDSERFGPSSTWAGKGFSVGKLKAKTETEGKRD